MGPKQATTKTPARGKPDDQIVFKEQYFVDTLNGRDYFKSFVNDDEQFCLGDFVMVKVAQAKGDDQLWPAEILHIWNDDGQGMAEVRWCYLRNELKNHIAPPKRLSLKVLALSKHQLRELGTTAESIQEEKEVFLSDEVDDCPVESISYQIKVVHPSRFASALRDDDDDEDEDIDQETITLSQQQQSDDDDEEEDDDDDADDDSGNSDGDEDGGAGSRVYFCVRQFFGRNNKRLIDVNLEDGLHWRNALEFSKHEYVTNAETIAIEDGGSFPMQEERNWFGGGMLTSPFPSMAQSSSTKSSTSKRPSQEALGGDASGGGGGGGVAKFARRTSNGDDPFAIAIDRLQLSSVPKKLPCREEEVNFFSFFFFFRSC
jgi:hypothetical protein